MGRLATAAVVVLAVFAAGFDIPYLGVAAIGAGALLVSLGVGRGGARFDRWALGGLVLIGGMAILHTGAAAFDTALLDTITYYRTVVGAALAFVVLVYAPRLLSAEDALRAIVLAAVVVAVVWAVHSRPMAYSSNAIAEVLAVGFVASVAHYDLTRERWVLLGVGVLGAGVAVGHARAAIVASLVGVGLWAVYRYRGVVHVRYALVGSLLAIIGGVVVVAALEVLTFNGRIALWSQAIAAIVESPLGHGFGEGAEYAAGWGWQGGASKSAHNAYLGMAAVFGVPAGVGYVVLYARALARGVRDGVTEYGVAFACLLAALAIMHLFYANPVFIFRGAGPVGAVAMGYLIRRDGVND